MIEGKMVQKQCWIVYVYVFCHTRVLAIMIEPLDDVLLSDGTDEDAPRALIGPVTALVSLLSI